MFFVIFGRRVAVRLRAVGRFWCLFCEADRDYQYREWRRMRTVFFLSVREIGSGEFVRCAVCENAFDPECLDESSTASCEELLVEVPYRALRAALSAESRDGSAEPRWSRAAVADALSANSSFRRH